MANPIEKAVALTMEDGPSQDDRNTPSVAMGIINDDARSRLSCSQPTRQREEAVRRSDYLWKNHSRPDGTHEGHAARPSDQRRMFPTWSEVLEVLKSLGYEKVGPDGG